MTGTGAAWRYAVFYAPAAGTPLHLFARAWLGRDPETGEDVPQPEVPELDAASLSRMTESPRRYGFHGTLKAPFRLAEGATRDALFDAARSFAEAAVPFEAPPLTLAHLGHFLALVPSRPCPALDEFAADCVRDFEPFRAPLNADELARRRESRLTPAQDALLLRWGYPYVFDAFRFHLTLGVSLDAAALDRLEAVLRPRVAPLCGSPLVIDSVCLFAEPEPGGAFRVAGRWPLAGG